MAKMKEVIPPLDYPACRGCSICNNFEPLNPILYTLHGKTWYCKKCFFDGPGANWPRKKDENYLRERIDDDRRWDYADLQHWGDEGYESQEA